MMRGARDVAYWQILLQKSGMTGHRGWSELLLTVG